MIRRRRRGESAGRFGGGGKAEGTVFPALQRGESRNRSEGSSHGAGGGEGVALPDRTEPIAKATFFTRATGIAANANSTTAIP